MMPMLFCMVEQCRLRIILSLTNVLAGRINCIGSIANVRLTYQMNYVLHLTSHRGSRLMRQTVVLNWFAAEM